jgi:hypothetical protein
MIDQRWEQRGILVPGTRTDDGVVVEITPESAGWTYSGFRAVRLQPGGSHSGHTGGDEVVIVVIGGTVTVSSSAGTWEHIGERPDPFAGLPYAAYLPPQTDYEVRARSAAEVALCAAPVREAYPARLIRPEGIGVLSRGAGAASRRIHNILMDDAEAGSIFITEIQSPAGHWSSYPPHKHDQLICPMNRNLRRVTISASGRHKGSPSSASTPRTGPWTRRPSPATGTLCWYHAAITSSRPPQSTRSTTSTCWPDLSAHSARPWTPITRGSCKRGRNREP